MMSRKKFISPAHYGIQTLARIFTLMAIVASLASLGTLMTWWIENTFYPSTKFEGVTVIGPTTLHVGESIQLKYAVTRYRSCKLEIGRYVRRVKDRREVLMQSVTQTVQASDPMEPRPSGYIAEIPKGLLDPGETEVDAEVFSRVQYFCNGLDYIIARIVDMETIGGITILATPAAGSKSQLERPAIHR